MSARRTSLLDRMAQLNALAASPWTDDHRALLCAALAQPVNILIARAAELMGQSGRAEFVPLLVERFDRLVRQPADADKNCHAKESIVLALDALDSAYEAPYLRGLRHVQMEPVFGGRADTAANLRGHCARALARMNYAEAHLEIAALLVDPVAPARAAAVNALAYCGDERSEVLLRLKALVGDVDPEITGACFTGLLAIAPERSVPFVAGFLNAADATHAEAAALALGESRLPEAVAALRACWDNLVDFSLRKTLLLAFALTRQEAACAFLLDVIREEGRGTAVKAVEAMAIFAGDERRRAQVRDAAQASGDPKVLDAFREHFGA